ncbi:division/cell wall cluster transcriptional repressor MraZ [Membranihabitans maritimus]|uniref:division/cell wall cluster transcriptional repressor MraZ n=1 Tax=Membranihabitans maritimus TaxID=2904244 RepID=UPI001F006A07|nr:division/cell wall cluster transcriptional repressor MraZ [Membranihabitans maritimus]
MVQLYGEYECRLDAKGRMRMPSQLLKQLGGLSPATFFVNRGFEKCIMIYPEKVWDGIVEGINKLNVYRQKDRNFIRYFYRGVSSVTTDSADRVLINKTLLEYADIEKDAVLFAYLDRIEMWDKDVYHGMLDAEPQEFSDLAEQVLGFNSHGNLSEE